MRSTSFATFATFIVYLIGLIFNATLANTAFFTFTPFAHLDLFRYLGGAEAGPYLFGVNSILDANFFVSLGVVVAINLLLGILSKLIFAKRDIT